MSSASQAENESRKSGRWKKPVILLTISLGLLWFSQTISPADLLVPESTGWKLWASYAKDLIQPFAFYFFVCLGDRWLKDWRWRALLAFAVPTLLEFSQYLYYRGATDRYVGAFDPLDIFMYAAGVGLAVLLEQQIFARKLKLW